MSYLLEVARREFPKFMQEFADQLGDRKGLAIEIVELCNNTQESAILGSLEGDNLIQKVRNAEVKIETLQTCKQPYTTFPYQKKSMGIWGGGVRGKRHLVAVSAFPPDLDHKFVMRVMKIAEEFTQQMEELIEEEFNAWHLKGLED